MTRGQLILIGIGILIVGLFVHEWYGRNSVDTGYKPSPMVQAQTHPAPPRVAGKKPASIEIKDYKRTRVDQFQFAVSFNVVNPGDEAAESIQIHVHPWVSGDYNPDRNGMQIDPADPINKNGKDDYIQRLEPKKSVTRSLQFYNVTGYGPASSSAGVTFTFKPAGSAP